MFGSFGEASRSRPFRFIGTILASRTLGGLRRKLIKPWTHHLVSIPVACGKVFIHNEVMDNFNMLWGAACRVRRGGGGGSNNFTID